MTLPAPVEFGAPDKFSSWRKDQDKAVLSSVDSEKRFIGLCLPTGSGKTTTLYAVLSILNKEEVNIVTLEDPVEPEDPETGE